jgi:T5orf172 domain-containing protein
MPLDDKRKRLGNLAKVPLFAAMDHRFFLDKEGKDKRLASLPRKERRQVEAAAKRIGAAYRRLLEGMTSSGAGYPADQLLRQLTIEYTHRYASSGLHNQPLNFNYFEPFCEIKLIEQSVAPYAEPTSEIDHLFSIVDYFDYVTSSESSQFELSSLKTLPEGETLHFTPTGGISDFTFLTAEGREFVVAGFSMVRRGSSLHWYIVGGEVFTEQDWEQLKIDQLEFESAETLPNKRPFLTASMERTGKNSGPPVALEGTDTAMRTIIAGEIDLQSSKYLGRCYMSERENSFSITCDDPELFDHISDDAKRSEMARLMNDRVERAAVMWNLAETMFRLPAYFSFRVTVARSVAVSSGQALVKVPKGGRGLRGNFRYVSAIEFTDSTVPVVRSYIAPHYQTETDGHWRRLPRDQFGYDSSGGLVRGKTWIRASNPWRERADTPRTIYVKSSIEAARVKVKEYVARAEAAKEDVGGQPSTTSDAGVVYVLRCMIMQDEVYKVGWTSGTAEERAQQLSAATGVPSSFAVVASWKHADPAALEKGVHAMLAPYRINDAREFFQVSYSTIRSIIEAEMARATTRKMS